MTKGATMGYQLDKIETAAQADQRDRPGELSGQGAIRNRRDTQASSKSTEINTGKGKTTHQLEQPQHVFTPPQTI